MACTEQPPRAVAQALEVFKAFVSHRSQAEQEARGVQKQLATARTQLTLSAEELARVQEKLSRTQDRARELGEEVGMLFMHACCSLLRTRRPLRYSRRRL